MAHAARVYDYLLGGTDNFTVDREAAEHAFATYPGGLDGVRTDARANRAFLIQVVRYLAGPVGIRQFLDIGTGIPNADNAHAVAQEVAPDARVVYVDNDPIVLAYAHELLRSRPEGVTSYLAADLRDPETILHKAAGTLDFAQPVAVLLIGILHVIPDEYDPHRLVATLLEGVPSGSYLAISQLTTDFQPEAMAEVQVRLDESMGRWNPPALRPRVEIDRFFEGLEKVELETADIHVELNAANGRQVPLYCALGRKP